MRYESMTFGKLFLLKLAFILPVDRIQHSMPWLGGQRPETRQ